MSEGQDETAALTFTVDGVEWEARTAGGGAVGWGSSGPAAIEAVHFYLPGETRPRFEALLTRGQLGCLYPVELVQLFRQATPVPPAA